MKLRLYKIKMSQGGLNYFGVTQYFCVTMPDGKKIHTAWTDWSHATAVTQDVDGNEIRPSKCDGSCERGQTLPAKTESYVMDFAARLK